VISFGNARIGEADLYRGLSVRKNERLRNGCFGAKRTFGRTAMSAGADSRNAINGVHGGAHIWDRQRSYALEAQILATPNQQIHPTDANCRPMVTSGRGSGFVGFNFPGGVKSAAGNEAGDGLE